MLVEQRERQSVIKDLYISLIKQFKYEAEIYQKLIEEEENKLEAIEEKDAQKLSKIVSFQEGILEERDILEKSRVLLIKELFENLYLPEAKNFRDLLDIDIDEKLRSELSDVLESFKEKIPVLDSIVKTNQKLLKNNKDFFASLLENMYQEPSQDLTYEANITEEKKR